MRTKSFLALKSEAEVFLGRAVKYCASIKIKVLYILNVLYLNKMFTTNLNIAPCVYLFYCICCSIFKIITCL